ncbi:glycosyltransferase family 2 protein [Kordiimonas marina]|uniref:glycosyltransferase family 2 protein n=1 Tax=Kordiimonas marina TaxID=2872312 RepID=UPI001FF69BAE|nr:glycosyltransferase family A protein [Kordiimonas marina]MCJ9429081.1 glycosyltransferase family 2 protein [Kordiimonas marina]
MPAVTIVISTYNRPELLRHTIQSVMAQTFEDWILLVVGDCCSQETADMMAEIDDERVFYHNLSDRCGEQSGPNSAGWTAAETDYVAFANHDDIWLPHHLEVARGVLEKGDVDFYCGASVLTSLALIDGAEEERPVCWEVTPSGRTYEQAFFNRPAVFEPISSWVMRRTLLDRVGAFWPAAQLHRTPLEHWIMRAGRADVPTYFAEQVTSIYCNAEKKKWHRSEKGEKLYGFSDTEGAFWLDRFRGMDGPAIEALIAEEISRVQRRGTFFRHGYAQADKKWLFEALLTPETARIFYECGWDAYDKACELSGWGKGWGMAHMLKRRTGEDLRVRVSWREVSLACRKALAADPRWRRMNGHA